MNIQFISSPLCCVFMFQGCKSSVLVSQNVRDVVTCVQCNKLRCIYSERALSNRENRKLKSILNKYSFYCRCMITPDVSFLSGTVFTRLGVGVLWSTKICIQKGSYVVIASGRRSKQIKNWRSISKSCCLCVYPAKKKARILLSEVHWVARNNRHFFI